MAKSLRIAVLLASGLMVLAAGAVEYVIESGDVVALTNAFKKSHYASKAAQILLQPGVYDLSGFKMDGSRHLLCYGLKSGSVIAGLGETPGDTVLLGGGAEDNCRVMDLYGGDVTVSNLTVTGGYLSSASDGAGINGGSKVCYRYLIVSNNYAKGSGGGGGAGCMKGTAYNCLFADNRTEKNGAALHVDSIGCGAADCVFSNNVATLHGGAFYAQTACTTGHLNNCKFYSNAGSGGSGAYFGGVAVVSNCVFKGNQYVGAAGYAIRGGGLYLAKGTCLDCKFIENASDGGGGLYVGSGEAFVGGCSFEKNRQSGWGSGSAVFVNSERPLAIVSNCFFNSNIATNYSSRTIVSNAELVDCVVTNHYVDGAILQNCNLTRCFVVDNVSTVGSGVDLDDVKTEDIGAMSRTNINCVFVGNHLTATTCTTGDKVIINCTYYANRHDSSNFGAPVSNCRVWNSLFVDNIVSGVKRDVRRLDHQGNVTQRYLTNCVFKAVGSDYDANAEGYAMCKVEPLFKFYPSEDGGEFDIKSRSPAFNAGVLEDWMVPILSGGDFAGRARVKYDAIDVGALECQHVPPFAVILR